MLTLRATLTEIADQLHGHADAHVAVPPADAGRLSDLLRALANAVREPEAPVGECPRVRLPALRQRACALNVAATVADFGGRVDTAELRMCAIALFAASEDLEDVQRVRRVA